MYIVLCYYFHHEYLLCVPYVFTIVGTLCSMLLTGMGTGAVTPFFLSHSLTSLVSYAMNTYPWSLKFAMVHDVGVRHESLVNEHLVRVDLYTSRATKLTLLRNAIYIR
jgi:hypothetical protein